MLSAIIGLARSRWTFVVLFTSKLWRRLLDFARPSQPQTNGTCFIDIESPSETSTPESNDPQADDAESYPTDLTCPPTNESDNPQAHEAATELATPVFPPTDDQRRLAKRKFISNIHWELVRSLASQFNDGRPCRLVNQKSGSFNACFFLEFDDNGPTWIVRVPIEPGLDDAWVKLQSEVATLKYLESTTKIPVPHVIAYGRDVKLSKYTEDTHMFLITDCFEGNPMEWKVLRDAKEEDRLAFYSQMIDILAELRRLEFPLIGSLMPNPDDDPTNPALGPALAIVANELLTTPSVPQAPAPSTFTSARSYMRYRFDVGAKLHMTPVRDYTDIEIRDELFALHHMEPIFQQAIDANLDNGPFILNHLDLRLPNIIVDASLRIQGIVDWEFSSTVPLQVFTPPPWLTGFEKVEPQPKIYAEFRSVLEEKGKTSVPCRRLWREWYQSPSPISGISLAHIPFCVAHTMCHPLDIAEIFSESFAPELFNRPLEDVRSEFCAQNPALMPKAQLQAELCARYTQHLRDTGCYETVMEKIAREMKERREREGW